MDTEVPKPTNVVIVKDQIPNLTNTILNKETPKPIHNSNGLFLAAALSLITIFIAPIYALIASFGGGIGMSSWSSPDTSTYFVLLFFFCPIFSLIIFLYKYLKGDHSANIYAGIIIGVISMVVFFLTIGRLL